MVALERWLLRGCRHWYPQLVLWSSEPAALNTLGEVGSNNGNVHARFGLDDLSGVILEIVHHNEASVEQHWPVSFPVRLVGKSYLGGQLDQLPKDI